MLLRRVVLGGELVKSKLEREVAVIMFSFKHVSNFLACAGMCSTGTSHLTSASSSLRYTLELEGGAPKTKPPVQVSQEREESCSLHWGRRHNFLLPIPTPPPRTAGAERSGANDEETKETVRKDVRIGVTLAPYLPVQKIECNKIYS